MPLVDELDSAIVGHLQTNARQTNRELARAVGIAPSTCLERVRVLRDRGVITGYHAEISLAALNRGVQALLHVQVRPLSRTVIEGFKAYAMALPEVQKHLTVEMVQTEAMSPEQITAFMQREVNAWAPTARRISETK